MKFFSILLFSLFSISRVSANEHRAVMLSGGWLWQSPNHKCATLADFDQSQFPDYVTYDVIPEIIVDGSKLSIVEQFRFKKCARIGTGFGFEVITFDTSQIDLTASNLMNHSELQVKTLDAQQKVRFDFALEKLLSRSQLDLYHAKKPIENVRLLVELRDKTHLFLQVAIVDLEYSQADGQYTPLFTDFVAGKSY